MIAQESYWRGTNAFGTPAKNIPWGFVSPALTDLLGGTGWSGLRRICRLQASRRRWRGDAGLAQAVELAREGSRRAASTTGARPHGASGDIDKMPRQPPRCARALLSAL